jgi:hypothetical protein
MCLLQFDEKQRFSYMNLTAKGRKGVKTRTTGILPAVPFKPT